MKLTKHALEKLEKRDHFDEPVTPEEVIRDIKKNKKSIKSSWPHIYHITWDLFAYIVTLDTVITIMRKKKYLTKQERKQYNFRRKKAKRKIVGMTSDYKKEIISQLKF